jgi:hypothetical protein
VQDNRRLVNLKRSLTASRSEHGGSIRHQFQQIAVFHVQFCPRQFHGLAHEQPQICAGQGATSKIGQQFLPPRAGLNSLVF